MNVLYELHNKMVGVSWDKEFIVECYVVKLSNTC